MLRSLVVRSLSRSRRYLCDTATTESTSALAPFEFVLARSDDRIGYVEIHRKREMNKLSQQVLTEIAQAMEDHDSDPSVNVILLHGSERVFAAGADVSELASRSHHSVRYKTDPWVSLDRVAAVRKPIVAAVSGFALGLGCELAMTADVLIAAEDATFGQPEVQLASIPAGGGTQRLVRAVGKAKAMEMILTGRHMNAEEAESAGLVSRVTKTGQAFDEAEDVAKVIARHSLPVVTSAKECVNVAFETCLQNGLLFERRAAQSAFALEDSKEGFKAFLDDRKPKYSNR